MEKQAKSNGILDWIERVGNKIPHPFILFFALTVFIVIVSTICASMGISVINPVTNKVVAARNLLSADGVNFMLQKMVTNFTGFSPLGLVLVMTLGIGLAEHVGLVSALMRNTILSIKASPTMLTFIIFVIGICGNIASDAAIVVVPVISAFIFLSLGRHPLAGIAVGYASTTAGFSANLIVAGTDALLAGISTEAVRIVNPTYQVSIVSNWYFMAVSTIMLAVVGTYVTTKIVEPRLGKYTGSKQITNEAVTPVEKAGLRKSGIYTAVYLLLIIAATIPVNSFLRNAKTGSLMDSPLLAAIVPLLFLLFLIAGVTYGRHIGKIKAAGDIPKYMTIAMKDMSSYIVLVFIIGQFIALFNWSNLGYILAVNGANGLKAMNLNGTPLFIMFILLSTFINIFIGSGSAKWALLAPIFIPMFYMLGYTPELTQVLYRIGDSATNIITPLFPYMPIILGLAQEYEEDTGVGTVISLMMPYSVYMLIAWIIMMIAWVGMNIPLGPGALLYLK